MSANRPRFRRSITVRPITLLSIVHLGTAVAFGSAARGQFLPEWQVNQPGSSLDLDGVQATPATSAVTTKCPGAPGLAMFASTNLGLLWEAGIGALPLVPRSGTGSLSTPGGQVVNLDLGDPALQFLFGGPGPSPVPFPGNLIVGFTAGPAPLTATIQQLNADP
jgi:hypothetical protein